MNATECYVCRVSRHAEIKAKTISKVWESQNVSLASIRTIQCTVYLCEIHCLLTLQSHYCAVRPGEYTCKFKERVAGYI